jgi:hypothetical protein
MSRHKSVLLWTLALSASVMFNAKAAEQTAVCAYFMKQYQASVQDSNVPGNGKRLCFEWYSQCSDEDIIAEQFWKLDNARKPSPLRNSLLTSAQWNIVIDKQMRYQDDVNGQAISMEADVLRKILVNDPPDFSEVTEIPLQDGRSSLIRIARRKGSASCESDTYMRRTPRGYKLFKEPTLDTFSAEASNCGTGSVWFATYEHADYVAHYFYRKLDVYLIDKKLKLSHVCSLDR